MARKASNIINITKNQRINEVLNREKPQEEKRA